jgi:hypothetical protein
VLYAAARRRRRRWREQVLVHAQPRSERAADVGRGDRELLERPADIADALVDDLRETSAGWDFDAFSSPWRPA